jgi:hypothetical protein
MENRGPCDKACPYCGYGCFVYETDVVYVTWEGPEGWLRLRGPLALFLRMVGAFTSIRCTVCEADRVRARQNASRGDQ